MGPYRALSEQQPAADAAALEELETVQIAHSQSDAVAAKEGKARDAEPESERNELGELRVSPRPSAQLEPGPQRIGERPLGNDARRLDGDGVHNLYGPRQERGLPAVRTLHCL